MKCNCRRIFVNYRQCPSYKDIKITEARKYLRQPQFIWMQFNAGTSELTIQHLSPLTAYTLPPSDPALIFISFIDPANSLFPPPPLQSNNPRDLDMYRTN